MNKKILTLVMSAALTAIAATALFAKSITIPYNEEVTLTQVVGGCRTDDEAFHAHKMRKEDLDAFFVMMRTDRCRGAPSDTKVMIEARGFHLTRYRIVGDPTLFVTADPLVYN